MKALLLLLFLLIRSAAYGHSPISKVLIIDTLAGSLDNFRISVIKPTSDPAYFQHINEATAITTVRLHKWPNVQTIVSTDTSNTVVRISLDDRFGYIEIENIFLVDRDTIRINKLNVFKNCFPDTTVSSYGWYRKFPLDTIRRIQQLSCVTKIDKISYKGCNISYPESIQVIVNSKVYDVPVCTARAENYPVKWYHGHKQMSEEKYMRMITSGKPYKYFAGSIMTKWYMLSATLKLK